MLALSLYQPWAFLVVTGQKTFETRSWPTKVRGWVAVHAAGATIPKEGRTVMEHPLFDPVARYYGVSAGMATCGPSGTFPTRAIIGMVRIVACVPSKQLRAEGLAAKEDAFGDFTNGRWAWQLAAPIRLYSPVMANGRQRFWEVPTDVQLAVLRTLKQEQQTLPDDLAVAVAASGV